MQIGSTTSWNTPYLAEHPARDPFASREEAADPSDQAPGTPEPPRHSDILADAARSGHADPSQLPAEEKAEVAELKRRDQDVRQHEGAHMAAGGAHVRGGASYSYQAGPDGKRYAVGGEVSIDASPVANNPEATIAKMQTVRRAALAPANPSGQDLAVAARASQAEMQARMQAAEQATAPDRGESVEASEQAAPDREGDPASVTAPSSPADVVGPAPVTTGSQLDTYA